jgi:tRNA A37 threonylcarbamoyladenosine synthetase subunit TsaC/SUA5/YrdC
MDPLEIRDILESRVELVIDGGFCGIEATTVVDLLEDLPRVIREGRGSIEDFVP